MDTYTIRTPDDVRTLRARLTNPRPILERIGGLLFESSAKAFSAQKLGDIAWAERYPGHKGQFLNVAAALHRANQGLGFLPQLRQDRPALQGSGELQRKVAFRVEGNTAIIGNSLDYASLHQFGGDSYQDITSKGKATIRGWLKGDTAPVRGVRSKLSSLLSLPFLVTKVNARPFLGITPDVQATIPRLLSDYLTTGNA